MAKDDKYVGCGISPLATGQDDPMQPACEWHDKAYTKDSWAEKNLSRLRADRHFRDMMLAIAGDNFWLRRRAYLYYYLARAFGNPYWDGKR